MPRLTLARSALTALALVTAHAAMAQDIGPGIAGPYLAARSAVVAGDHRVAATYFDRALLADPNNSALVGNALFANASLGNWDRAATVVDLLDPDAPGQDLAGLVRFVNHIRAGDLIAARQAIEAGAGAGPFIDDLALGWIHLGEGDMRRASETFERVAEDQSLGLIAYLQLAYARAAVGDFEGADAILSGEEVGTLQPTERSARAHAQILVQLDRRDDAIEMLEFFTQAVPDPAILTLLDTLRTEDEPGDYTFLTTPQQGLAEVFYIVSRALGTDDVAGNLPLVYAQAARGIDPRHSEATLFAGEILTQEEQYDLAAEVFASIADDDVQYAEAQMGRADALFEAGATEAALNVLADLSQARPDLATVHAAYGDMLRRSEQCEAAIPVYTDALDLMDTSRSTAWFLFYTRAICYEDIGDWPPAESDFRRALELNPEQPSVLNYLGYSLVEQRRNLDEALDMIERAVAARPSNGYITDSLGWVLYRLGRFDEAVEPMERAVELEPNDPIINDHLGDVYWMVGRYREAEFQWHRALSFDPEPEDAERIRLKLEVGLYDVLEAEGGVGVTE
ncbi:MAG: tetratricopeptide repeat protein [Pseudomonadota bacterium]